MNLYHMYFNDIILLKHNDWSTVCFQNDTNVTQCDDGVMPENSMTSTRREDLIEHIRRKYGLDVLPLIQRFFDRMIDRV